ncbi:hypothetical protein ACLBXO_22670 [Methylobacterium sp. C33D]
MYASVLGDLEISVEPPGAGPPPEALILREHIRRILRKLTRPAASAQYS